VFNAVHGYPTTPSRCGPSLIDRVETFLVDLPTIRPHQLSMATMNGQTLMLVRLYCSDGTVGVGEGTTIGGLAYGAESPEGMKLAIDTYFAPLLLGADASLIPAIMARLNKAIQDNRFAKCAIETALFDALGQRTGLPISQLLGGRARESLPIAWTLASATPPRTSTKPSACWPRAATRSSSSRSAAAKSRPMSPTWPPSRKPSVTAARCGWT
jgi:L-alanine-DL-glutamate epimerase-like enolase superfamily enzyme